MKKILKWTAVGLVATVVFAVVAVYAASELRRNRQYDTPLTHFTASTALAPAEAERRARSFMCFGCHREAGNVIFEAPGVGKLVAPNLTRLAPTYSDAELERLLRHGVKKDGSGAIAMPAATFANLADEDVSAIIAWLRSRDQLPDAQPSATDWGPLGRLALALEQVPYEADHLPAVTSAAYRPKEIGRYLYSTTCSHCHDLDAEREVEGITTPALRMIAPAYSPETFRRLLRTGKALGERELKLMSSIARDDLSYFSDEEIEQIYRFLTEEGAGED